MNLYNFLSKAVGETVTRSKTNKGTNRIWIIEFSNNTSYHIYCSWRFKCAGMIITTSFECVTTGMTTDGGDEIQGLEYMNKHVERLIGSKLLSYELSAHYDLTLYFENNYSINLFCDSITHGSKEDAQAHCSWLFFVPEEDTVGGVTGHFEEVFASEIFDDEDDEND